MANFKNNLKILTACLAACLFFVCQFAAQASDTDNIAIIPPPIILETSQIQVDSQYKIMVKGLIRPGYEVLIYINGSYSELANISQGNAEYSIFEYLSPLENYLEKPEILAISRHSSTHLISAPVQSIVYSVIENNAVIRQNINNPYSTPLKASPVEPLLAPVLIDHNNNICEYRPYISGYSKNQTYVNIYVDDKLSTNFWLEDKTASKPLFSYLPDPEIERGLHSAYAIANDKGGRISAKSNLIKFCVSSPQAFSTSTSLDQEDVVPSSTIKQADHASSASAEFLAKDKNSAKDNQSKIQINLILFALFVIIVIVWMIIVNRELSKENKENDNNKAD